MVSLRHRSISANENRTRRYAVGDASAQETGDSRVVFLSNSPEQRGTVSLKGGPARFVSPYRVAVAAVGESAEGIFEVVIRHLPL